MRLTWLLLVCLATSIAEARTPAPRRVLPPFDRNCMTVDSAAKLQTCIDTHAKGAKVQRLTPELTSVATVDGRQYLFVAYGETWRMVYRPGDANYELVSTRTMTVRKQPARRIDLSHHVALGNNGMFVERVTLVCTTAPQSCAAFVTACTVMNRGRAVETFRGELRETDGLLTLVGDRTYAGSTCGRR